MACLGLRLLDLYIYNFNALSLALSFFFLFFQFLAENLNRPGTSNFSNVISQILLCKTITPDFNAEEICSIAKDSEEIEKILQEMQEYMPQQENQAGESLYNNLKLLKQ